jgi:hypothetical protein
MATRKLSISFDQKLEAAIRSAAISEQRSVSSWIAEAALQRLRLIALGEAVSSWEAEHGALTEKEIGEADRIFERAANRRTRKSLNSQVA